MKSQATKRETIDRLSTAEEVQFACGISEENAAGRAIRSTASAFVNFSPEDLAQLSESELAYLFSQSESQLPVH